MDEFENKKTGRHAKVFDLLRKGDLRDEPEERVTATVARYLDDDAAHRFLTRGMSSFKSPVALPDEEKRATRKAAPFSSRQTD